MKSLPDRPHLDALRKEAKQLLAAVRQSETAALASFAAHVPHLDLQRKPAKLHDAQFVLAREYGYANWTELKQEVEFRRIRLEDRRSQILALVASAVSNNPHTALQLLQADPSLVSSDFAVACVAGDLGAVSKMLATEKSLATTKLGPLGWAALHYVCQSRLQEGRSDDVLQRFAAVGQLLIESGADPNEARIDPNWPSYPLSPLYGACERDRNPFLAEVLLKAGATPDDNESLYHSLEGPTHRCLDLLLAAGVRTTRTNALPRALDHVHREPIRKLLEYGADPNEDGIPVLQHAIVRGHDFETIKLLVEHGADPNRVDPSGRTALRVATWLGRSDLVSYFVEQAGGVVDPQDQLLASLASGEQIDLEAAMDDDKAFWNRAANLMTVYASRGDLKRVKGLLAAGCPTAATSFNTPEALLPERCSPLHWSAWRGDAAMVQTLLDAGADLTLRDGHHDGTPMNWLVHAVSNGVHPEGDHVTVAKLLLEHGAEPPNMSAQDEVFQEWWTQIPVEPSP